MRQKGAKSDGGSWEFREYDVTAGVRCFLLLRQLCQKAKYRQKKGGDEEHESGEIR